MGIRDALKENIGDAYSEPSTATEGFIEEDKEKDFTYGTGVDDITDNGNKFLIFDKIGGKEGPHMGKVLP